MVTYACIAPLLMPFGVVFFLVSYTMYKYQLLYVYVNDNQSLGFMWYAVFNRSLIALLFSSFTLLACFAVNADSIGSGPFFMTVPLPIGILYFWHYCDSTLKKNSMVSGWILLSSFYSQVNCFIVLKCTNVLQGLV